MQDVRRSADRYHAAKIRMHERAYNSAYFIVGRVTRILLSILLRNP
jgi:hypothetical protein